MKISSNVLVLFKKSEFLSTLRRPARFALCVVLCLAAFSARSHDLLEAPADEQDSPPQRRGGGGPPARGVYKSRITPHWFHNNTRFWYTNGLPGGTKEFIVVDAEKGTRGPAFDHAKLAAALSKAANREFKGTQLPFSEIEFVDDAKAIRFTAADKTWKCNLTSYECTETAPASASSSASPAQDSAPQAPENPEIVEMEDEQDGPPQAQGQVAQSQRGRRGGGGGGGGFGGGRGRGQFSQPQESPDGKWRAFVTNYNIVVRSTADGTEHQLTQDGVTNNYYNRLTWTRDSKSLVAWRTEPGPDNMVYIVRSSPEGAGPAVLEQRHYAQPGNKFTAHELSVFDIATFKQIKPEVERVDFGNPNLRWNSDGIHFTYEKVDRGHQRFRIIEVNARTGAVRNIYDEQTKTFIWTAHAQAIWNRGRDYLDETSEIIIPSERDGWRHLYLIDAKAGKIKTQITKGEWVVRAIDEVDREKRQIWFQASGRHPDQDPYFLHFYRVNFDGSGLVALTEGNGTHSVQYSPDKKFLIDTYSRVDMPPVHELRRVSDGKLVCKLEETDITELKATGWRAPEVFVAKGRDDKTDIWGFIVRPRDFDPSRKYPVLEAIYAGPHDSHVPKPFSAASRHEQYTSRGFIVVQIDGMGTANRSKAFHDVCWQNLKDAGFPDRIKWIKAAGAKYSHMDLDRVGIYGTSAGGQNAAGAVIFHGDFYKAAVANCGCHDNRIDKASWNEQWMGYMPPDKIWVKSPDNWYSRSSNIDNAERMKGRLLLILGEADTNVPPESTMRLVDALIQARKDFDLFVVPNGGHGAGSPLTGRRAQDFFMRHLQGVEPPNRNAGDTTTTGI